MQTVNDRTAPGGTAARPRRARRERGLSLVEVALALGVAAASMAGMAHMLSQNASQARSKAVASRMVEVSEASKGYLRAHYNTLLGLATAGAPVVIPVGRTSGSGAVPAGPGGLPSVQGGGFLAPNYIDLNAYGQSHALLVRQPTAGQLEAMVTTYGGNAIPDRELVNIPPLVGANAGAVMGASTIGGTSVAGQVVGAFGGWRTATATWASTWSGTATTPAEGRVVANLTFQVGNVLNDYLYRTNIGIPEANTMRASIDMGDTNDINNVRDIEQKAGGGIHAEDGTVDVAAPGGGAQSLRVNGDATATGAVRACAGDALNCRMRVNDDGSFANQNNGWVAFQGDVPGGGLQINGTGNNLDVGGNATVGGTTTSAGRVFARSGVHLNLGQNLTWGGGTEVGGWYMNDTSWVRTYNNVGIHSGTGTIRTDGNAEVGRKLFVGTANTAAWPTGWGDGVHTRDLYANGTIGTGTGGALAFSANSAGVVSAQDMIVRNRSTTVSVSALLPRFVPQYSYVVANGNLVPKPTCAAGGAEKIIVVPTHYAARLNISNNPFTGAPAYSPAVTWMSYRAAHAGASAWQVIISIGSEEFPDVNNARGLATTYCYYP